MQPRYNDSFQPMHSTSSIDNESIHSQAARWRLGIAAIVVLFTACSQKGVTPAPTDPAAPFALKPTTTPVVPLPEKAQEGPGAKTAEAALANATPEINDGPLIARVEKAIQRHRLTKLRKDQLSFEVSDDPEPGFRDIDVREKHEPEGPGDPSTAPRLFSFRVELSTGKLYSDARSDLGDFLPIKD
jgi:hypothetical protein